MQEFMRKFEQFNGKRAKVILEHCLFGDQSFYCAELQTIDSDTKCGVVIHKQDIFVYKHNIKVVKMHGHTCVIGDERLSITIILDK